ncbi:uncharacterized protein K441DRAFT_660986 [Cenococcum geophilum 1.58]|uniref:uncharacterized protein n=1 Tax=Cenococcum geophilum 1.58 TaxID=794803 RepID=UPI00358F3950|nr:hypothetical protein K441DRAFT_660986 [Cenococcum geophilum 1.58]
MIPSTRLNGWLWTVALFNAGELGLFSASGKEWMPALDGTVNISAHLTTSELSPLRQITISQW